MNIPRSAKLALQHLGWRVAMKNKYEALIKNKTWKLIPKTEHDKVINTKWVFKIKHAEDGTIQRFKTRWVANGMRQIESCDYNQTFSPVVRANLVRIVLSSNNKKLGFESNRCLKLIFTRKVR